MKTIHVILLLSLLSLSSCEKDICKTCIKIIESNEFEANKKCEGLANSYPAFKEISRIDLGESCGSDLSTKEAFIDEFDFGNYCDTLKFSTRIRFICN